MSESELKTRTRLAMGELIDRILGGIAPAHSASPARALDLSELEERILLSASPAMAVAEMADAAMADSMTVETATAENEVVTPSQSDSSSSSNQQSDSSVSTDPSQNVSHEIVFLDTSVEDYQQLLDDLWNNDDPSREIEVVLLSSSRDGIDQISEALAGREDLDAVHIVSHGTDAAVKLGSTWLTQDNLAGYVGEIARWGNSLSADADLLFYGCDLAASSDGQDLIDSLATLTGADVAASDDDTGHAIFGADWDLEYATGDIETAIAFSESTQDNWGHIMNVTVDATSTGTTTGSSLTISHTTTSAADRLMLVGISIGEDSPPSVTSVTYNGTSLTSEGSVQSADGGTVEIFSLVAPTSGTHDVVVTLSGNGDAIAGVMTFAGVDQATPLGTFASGSGDASSGSVAVGSATGELVFGVVTVNDPDRDLVPGGGQTERWDLFAGFESNGGGSTEAGAPSVDLSWSWSSNTGWAIGGISIKPTSTPTTTITVNTTNDVLDGDADTSSLAALIATPGSDGAISLREAITAANNQTGADTIEFSIAGVGPHTISLASALPVITDEIFIDGWSEPDHSTTPIIVLDGTGAGSANGINLQADDSTVRGLVIHSFGVNGILINGGSNNTFVGNYIGTDVSGSVDLGNTSHGISINNNSLNNIIGGTGANEGNVISGNNSSGININNGSDGTSIIGNIIGLNAGGTADLGNTAYGILIGNSADVDNTVIGGTTAAHRNIISGNDKVGIRIRMGSSNTVLGNYIGTDITGAVDLGNSEEGIHIESAGNTVGGSASGAGNVISGNTDDGVLISGAGATSNIVAGNLIGLNAAGTSALSNDSGGVRIDLGASGNTIGGDTDLERNVISGNSGVGVELDGAVSNTVSGNYIGTDINGTTAIGNTQGILFDDAAVNNTIGGTTAGERNVISGNLNEGILITDSGTTGNVVVGNYIGVDVSGTVDLGNADDGVQILGGATNNTIGGTTAAERNVISGNDDEGVEISGTGTSGNVVLGNYIGVDVTGSSAIGNSNDGVLLESGATNNTIGGTAAGSGNVISGDGQDGIRITGTGTSSNLVQGNYIGTNAAGTAALGNTRDGVKIESGATGNTIGGDIAAARNLISGNRHGVDLTDSGTDANIVQGNYIGTDAAGTGNLGNLESGVYVSQSASDNLIGGTGDGEGNLIAFNSDIGVRVTSTAGTGNSILRNSIHSNAALGIDLDPAGVTPNDTGAPGDADIGPNNLQNYPVLASAFTDGSNTVAISGTLNSTALTTFRLEFFSNNGGGDEGETYLGFRNVISNSTGDVSFVESFTANVGFGVNITATATNLATGDTSEFSAVQASASALIVDTTTDTVDGTTTSVANLLASKGADGKISLREAIIATNNTAGHDGIFLSAATYTLSIAGTSEDFAATGDLNVRDSLSLIGAGAGSTIIDGADLDRIFQTYSGSDYFFQGLTVQNASSAADGGALNADGAVTIADSVFQDNVTTNGGARGAAIRSNGELFLDTVRFTGNTSGGNAGALYTTSDAFVVDSLFDNNSATGSGGAIWHDGVSPLLELINVTMSGNSATGEGGALYAADNVNLINVTITDNLAGGHGGGFALGAVGPTISVYNSIIAGNSATTADPDFHGTNVSQGYNIIGDTTGSTGFGTTGDQQNVDPLLAPLADNGGPTLTHALYSGSPAENAGDPGFASLTVDQRGTDRDDGSPDIGAFEGTIASNIIVVDTTSDDATGSDTSSITALFANKGADGKISLREAIEAANNTTNFDGSTPDEIRFEILDALVGSAHTIELASALPDISDAVVINGTTDSDFSTTPIIVLDGSGAGSASGLTLIAGGDGSTIQGLVINRFTHAGIIVSNSDNNTIVGNFIGTDVTGTVDQGNLSQGIHIQNDSSGNTVGGTTAALRNVISGNDNGGINIRHTGTDNNVVIGNYIGSDINGTGDLGNANFGVRLTNLTTSNTVGGINPGEGNVIAFNDDQGVRILNSATGNAVLGNLIHSNTTIGIDLNNDGVTANDADDVDVGTNNLQNFPVLTSVVTSGTQVTITGTLDTDGLNQDYRVEFFSNDTADGTGYGEGRRYLGFATVTTNGSGDGSFSEVLNVPVAFGASVTATATVDQGGSYGSTSEFGLNVSATGTSIINVDTTSDVSDGDVTSIEALLTDKGTDGFISLREAITATNNSTNGTNADEIRFEILDALVSGAHTIDVTAALPTITDSVIINGATDSDFSTTPIIVLDGSGAGVGVDGLTLGAASGGSTIRGLIVNQFSSDGIVVASDGNTIAGNYIGTDLAGTADLGNLANGLQIDGANNTIGGSSAADRNVISGNNNSALWIQGGSATGNLVTGNYLGVDSSGASAIGNSLVGVLIANGAGGNTIGGLSDGQENVISGNSNHGIEIHGGSGNTIIGNLIGTDASGTLDVGNGGDGVLLQLGTTNNTIGGDDTDEGNTIAFNTGDGIELKSTAGIGNSILGNSIHSNTGLGIDIEVDGVTANDSGDGDVGANNLQNFPVLNSAVTDGSTEIDIAGSINTSASETVLVQFYANDANDGSGYGEGQTYLGFTNVTTGADGNATFDVTLSAAVAEGAFISATATSSGGSTSEFALSVAATGSPNTRPYFGANGDGSVTTTIPGSSLDLGFGSVVQDDGKIIVAGGSNLSDFDISLVRYHADGSVDQTFGSAGIVTLDLGGSELGFDIALQSDGKIMVAGQTDIGADIDLLTVRFNVDGSLDTSFDSDGYAIVDINGDDSAANIAIQTDGKIVVVGTNDGSGHDFSVVRYETTGVLDTTFDSDGIFTHDFGGSSFDQATSVALQSDGKIIVGGSSAVQFGLLRLTTAGVVDTTFDTDGKVTTDFGAGSETINSLVIQADGKIIAGGTANLDFALARYNTDGSLDTTFDTDGLQTSDMGATEQAYDIALTASEKILISGSTNIIGDNDVMVQRYNSDGSIDTSFNTVGTRITVVGGTSENGYSVNSLDDGTVLVGGSTSSSGFILNRYLESGPEDTSFGATTNLLNGNPTFTEGGAAVVLDADVQVFDVELDSSGNYDGAALTLVRDGGADSDDVFSETGTIVTLGQGGNNLNVDGVTIGSVSSNSGGMLTLTFNSNATTSLINSTLQQIAYSNSNVDPESSVLITWTFNDGNTGSQGTGGALAATGSTTVNITPANNAPTLIKTGNNNTFDEGDDPVSVEGLMGLSDDDSSDFDGGILTVDFTANSTTSDRLAIHNAGTGAGQIGVSASNVTYEGITIGSFTGGTDGSTPLVVTFNANSTEASVQLLIRSVTFENVSENPSDSTRTVRFVLTDGDGGTSNTITKSIGVNTVNDDPVITSDSGGATAALNVTENSTAVTTVTSSDVDGGTASYSITGGADSTKFSIVSGTGVLTFVSAPDFESPIDVGANNVYEVTVEVSDGNGGTDSQDISVTVDNLDATPTNSVPGDQTVVEDATLTFNAANSNLISISAEGDEVVTVSLSVNDGSLSLSQTTGLTFTNGDGTDDAAISFSGTISNINSAIDGLEYTPNADFNGSDSLKLVSTDTATIALDSDANLLGYYEFTSPTPGADSSPVGTNTATLQGGATIVTDSTTSGDALSLDGSGDYAQITGEFGQPADLTLAAWINGTAGYGEIFSIQNRVILRFDDINGSTGVSAIYHDGTTYQKAGSGQFLEDTGWHHVAMTFSDASKTLTLYIDGVQAAQDTFTASISYLGGNTFIGSNKGESLFFEGLIDEARVFDRALSAGEISTLAASAVYLSDSDTVTINVDPGNDAPTITLPGTTVDYTENDPATIIDATATISDVDSANFDGGEFRVGFAGGTGRDGDTLSIRNQGTGSGQIGVTGSTVSYEGTDIGTFTGGTSSTQLVVALNTAATPEATQALARNITFENTSDNPSDTTRTVRFDVLDGDGGDAMNVNTTVDVTAENDAPTITSNGGGVSAAIDIEDGSTTVTTITSSDPDGGTASYSISGGADSTSFNIDSVSGALTLKTAADFASPADATGDGVYEVTVTVSDGAGGTDSQSIQATIVAPDVRLVYGQSTDATPQFREFDTIRDILSGEATTTEAGSTIRWSTSVLSPDGTEELVAILSDTGSATELNLLRWDGESWTVDWTATDIASANSDARGFSIAYESSSGHAVAVYSNNTANPVYRTWDGSSWSAEADVFATAPGSGTVLWVELASSPISDEITLVYSDSAELHTVVWDGSAWNEAATEKTLEETLAGSGNSRAFDVAYESSGDVVIAWGDGSDVDFETRAAGTTTWIDGVQFPVVSGIVTFVDLAADPTSDQIAFAGIDDNAGAARLGLMTWDGSAWQDVGEYDSGFPHVLTDGFGEFWAGVGWAGTTGEAVAVYSDADSGVLNWASWTVDSGWTIESDFTVTGAGLLRSVELAGYGNDGVATIFSDENGSLWGLTYEGGSWTILNGGAALETTVSDFKTKPFSLSVERFGGNDASIVDLNGSDTAGTSFSTGFTEGGGRISVTGTDATVSDIDHATYQALNVNLAGFNDDSDEEIRINNEQFDFGVSKVITTTVGATTFNLDFDGSGFAIDNDAGGVIPEADLQALVRLFEYENKSLSPTDGNRTFSFRATDAGGLTSTSSVSTISVSGVNNRPTLTAFADSVDTTLEDTEVEVTFAEIAAQGNESDADGTVTAFVVKSVPTGSLKIGLTVDTATAYSAGSNNVIDATRNAYWTPSLNSNGTRNSFTVVARDNLGLESIGNIAVPVDVTPVNDDPTISAIADQTPNEDTATGAIAFTVGDVETAAGSLTVTATSSDQTLVPDGNITLGGSGVSRTINVLPGTNENGGPATITVSVFDGDATTQMTFDVTVTAVNDAPVASISFAGYGVDEDDSQRILTGVSVSDVDAGSSDVSVTVSVDDGDLTVTTTTGLTFTAGANGSSEFTAEGTISELNAALGTLRYQSDPNFNGTDTFTLSVDDLGNSGGGALTSMDSVPITVTAVNDAPLLDLDADDSSLATGNDFNQTFEEGAGPVSLVDDDVTLSDIDSANLSSITVALANRLDPASKEELSADASGTPLSANWDSGTNTLTINGSGTVADYLAVLSTVKYDNTANNPDATTRTITFVANDGTSNSLIATTTLTFSAVNDAPVINSDGGAGTAAVSVAENVAQVTTVTSTDVDGGTPVYSISGGADSTKFNIDSGSGILKFVAAPDFESPTDTDGDNDYEVTVQVSDQNGGFDTQTITVTVTAENDNDPVITSDGGGATFAIDVAENSTAVTTVTATDDDLPAQTLSYSISGGADSTKFNIDSGSGLLTFATAPDFDSASDTDGDNDYEVTVQVSDGAGRTDSQDITVTVTDLNDTTPIVDGGQPFFVIESATDATSLGNVTATDPDTVGSLQSWAIVSGNTSSAFAIDSASGELTVSNAAALDFETLPTFTLTVRVSDGANTSANQTVTVNVTNANDAPVVSAPASDSVAVGETLAFSAANGNAITVSDVEESELRIQLSVDDGSLTLSSKTGLVFLAGTGTADAAMTFEGSIDNINAALEGLEFVHGDNHSGICTVTIEATDFSATGPGGPITSTDMVAINVLMPAGPPISGDAFLQGNFLEVGLGEDGVLGSQGNAPVGFNSAGAILGVEVDHDRDGFGVGQVDGDFILPGTPEEAFGVSVGGTTTFNSNSSSQAIAGSLSNFQDTGTTQTLDFTGTASGLQIDATHSVGINDQFMDVAVTLTNSTDSALPGVYYFRNVDPDNNFDTSGTFATTNTVISQGDDGSAQAYVTATQADGSLLGLLGFGENARVTRGGFSNRDPIAIWDGSGGLSQTGTSTADEAVSLSFKFDSIEAGESVTFSYRYVFGETQAPVLDLDPDGSTGAATKNVNVSYVENDGAIAIVDTDATIFDGDSTNLTGLTVQITNDLDGAAESLSADTTGTSIIASAYNSTTGVLSLTGADTVANYRQVLRTISYINTSETPDTTTRQINFSTTDGTFTSNTVKAFVSVTATNDLPVITSDGGADTATVSIPENSTDVTTVTSTDLDSDTPSYSITGGADSTKFNIDSDSGVLTFVAAPDFENATDFDTDNQYEVTVSVSDGNGGTDSQDISVTVTAVNDNAPQITSNGGGETATIDVAENSTAVTTVAATDADLPAQELDYTISGGADAARFNIGTASGELTFAASPNFEAATDSGSDNTYEVIVRVSDGISFFELQTITVSVTDVDEFDVSPISDADGGADSVNENASNGVSVGIRADATDDDGTNNTVTYSLDNDSNGEFFIESSAGDVKVAGPIDREAGATRTIVVRATSEDGSFTTKSFTIAINDVNEFDITAISDSNGEANTVDENAAAGTAVGITASASDGDATTNGITYTLDDDSSGEFTIDSSSGEVEVAGPIDRESGATRTITVRAVSEDGSFSTKDFTIDINDVDEFDITAISDSDGVLDNVDENVSIATTVGLTAFAEDRDATTNGVSYSLDDDSSGEFQIDASSGEVTVAATIDRESGATRTITVRATSDDGSSTTKDFTITINDLDEFDVSAITDTDGGSDNVDENASVGVSVGVRASAADDDATNNEITYSLDDDSNGEFFIEGSAGDVKVAGPIDREAGPIRTITVRATSEDGSFTTKDFTIVINDLNDNAPIVDPDQSFSVSEFAADGDIIGNVTATDQDTVGLIQNWSIANENSDGIFEIDPVSGDIRVVDNDLLNFETTATHILGLRVEDGANTSLTQTVTINVVDENDAPVLDVNAGTSVVEGGSVLITSAELSVSDEDELPEKITYSTIDAPTAGRLELVDDPGIAISTFTQADIDNSQVRFVHDGSEADDSFTFTISDGSGGTNGTTLFSIANLRVNDAPINTTPAAQTVDEDSPLVFSTSDGNSIAVSDVDLDGGMIGVRLVATNGTLTLSSTTGLVFANGDGDQNLSMVFAGTLADVNSALDGLRFDPAADFNGAASVRIVSRDMGASGSGGEQLDDDTINIEVVPVNDTPIATDDEYSTSEDNSLTVSAANGLLSNDSDIDGDDLSVTLGTGTANGTLSVNADGSFVYTPNANFNGADSFTYQATDGSLVSEIQTVTLTVAPVNDASVSIDDEFIVDQLSVLNVRAADGVLVNDLDIEADGLQAILVDGPQNGKLVLNADGSLTYTPNATFFGEDTFTYQAFDGTDDGSIATVRIDVLQTVTSGSDGGDGDIVIEEEAETSDGDEAVDGDNGTTDVGPDATVDDTGDVSTESTLTAPPTVTPNEDTESTTITTNTPTEIDDGTTNGSGNEQPLFEAAFQIDERGELRDRLTGRIVEDAGVVVFTSTDVGSMVYVLEQTGFWTELDTFEQDVQNSILQEGEWEELVVETTTVAGTTLTVGYIVWLLRSGSVVFGLVSSLPAWTMMDPLPVLQSGLEGLDDTDTTDDDSLQGILQAHHDGMEHPAESFEN